MEIHFPFLTCQQMKEILQGKHAILLHKQALHIDKLMIDIHVSFKPLEMLQLTKPACIFLQRAYRPKVKAIGADKPLAVVPPIGELVPKEALVRLAVMLPLGELLPYPKPAGSVRRPGMWPLEVMLPVDGEPLAVMLPLKGNCTPASYKVQTCNCF